MTMTAVCPGGELKASQIHQSLLPGLIRSTLRVRPVQLLLRDIYSHRIVPPHLARTHKVHSQTRHCPITQSHALNLVEKFNEKNYKSHIKFYSS